MSFIIPVLLFLFPLFLYVKVCEIVISKIIPGLGLGNFYFFKKPKSLHLDWIYYCYKWKLFFRCIPIRREISHFRLFLLKFSAIFSIFAYLNLIGQIHICFWINFFEKKEWIWTNIEEKNGRYSTFDMNNHGIFSWKIRKKYWGIVEIYKEKEYLIIIFSHEFLIFTQIFYFKIE